jgi:hypothetical protein
MVGSVQPAEARTQKPALHAQHWMAVTGKSKSDDFAAGVGRALRRAAKEAQKIARMHNTPVY